jgi:gliding motility-associated-like protein
MDFTLINASGCDSIVSVEVVAYPEMNFDFQLIESCPNIATGELSVDMVSGGVPPYSYAVDGFPFQTSPDFASLSAGVHTVAVQDAAGCTLEVDFDIPALPVLIVDTKNTILPCESLETTLEVQVLSGEDVSFQWEDGSTDAFLQVTEPGNYVVNISNTCETITQTIEVNFEDPNLADYLYVPNAFSPNNDGINDIFMAYPARDVSIEEYTLNVFDRWGNQLFSTDNPSDGWRGAFKSKDLKTGVYIWQMKAKVFSCGRMVEVERQGDVALLK